MKKILWECLLFLGILSVPTLSFSQTRCMQNNGQEYCITPKPKAWNYSSNDCLATVGSYAQWCEASGGNWSGTYALGCVGATPFTKENYISRGEQVVSMRGNIVGKDDTGWNTIIPKGSSCQYQSPIYLSSIKTRDARNIHYTYKSKDPKNTNLLNLTIYHLRSRDLECPIGYSKYTDYDSFSYCIGAKKKSTCDTVGNPCSVTSGIKTQFEKDWEQIPFLIWERTYNSDLISQNSLNNFYTNEPSKNLIGASWTHNYNLSLSIFSLDENDGEIINTLDKPNYPTKTWGILKRKDGREIYLEKIAPTATNLENQWFISKDENLKLTQQNGLWRIDQLKTGIKEYYDQTGKLIKIIYPSGQYVNLSYGTVQLDSTTLLTDMLTQVTDHYGRSLKFNYNAQGLISSVILPNNKNITYQYDAQNRLVSVKRPSYGTKTYHYSENSTVAPSGNPNLLTGITDEIGKRYANYAYDTANRGILTEHADGAQKYTLQHNNSSTTVIDPNGATWLYNKVSVLGTTRVSSSYNSAVQVQNSYDQSGNITQKVEKGLTTKYTYDLSRNLEISRTEAVGTAQERKIETTWHTEFPKPIEIKELAGGQTLRVASYSYDAQGNALSKTITDPQTQESRIWTYEYNQFGQIVKETSPQGQISTYQYDETNGNLLKTIDSIGVVTIYSQHNADGQPQHIASSTGQVVDVVYDDAGRIIQQKQSVQQTTLSSNGNELSWWQELVNAVYDTFGAEQPYEVSDQTPEILVNSVNQNAITLYEYDPRGLLVSTTLPDGEKIEYGYDDAHRLTQIKDQSGNKTLYTLNANGDITQTEVYGTSGQLEAKNQQVYDTLGRLQQSLGNNQQKQTNSYDSYDQVITDTNALNQTYRYGYDVLGRQVSETDPLNGINKTEYDALDQIKKVIDAKGGTTTYNYNAFGEKIGQSSPDTGITTYQYENGKLLEKVDANQRKHRYQYDAQGRVILQQDQKTDGSDDYESTQFEYGQSGHHLGQLTLAKNKRAETQLNYNSLGLVSEKSVKYLTTNQTTPQLKTYYSYTLGGKLKQMALPSGNVVNYDYNATGEISGIRLNDQSFIKDIQYNANGIKAWTYTGLGDTAQFEYDLDGRIKRINMPNVYDKNYSFDSADRILSILDANQPTFNSNFKHDALSRLIEQSNSNKTLKYSYDKNSNRLMRQTVQGTTITTENYSIANDNNRLTAIQQGTASKTYQYLPTGQITTDGVRNYTYDAQGRSETISQASGSILNGYDALGQRIQKFGANNVQTLFMYDENGQLLGEYSADGKVIREYIWLGTTLVGLRSSQYPNEILRVHTDHLGTPRAISNNSNQVVWRWEGDQFGDVLPTGNLTFPIRHAGQYYDQEVNIFYNYFRDYDPITGRYVESDPIGLDGGLNTYGYVGGNVLRAVDPKGEAAQVAGAGALLVGAGSAIGAGVACYATDCGQIIPVAWEAGKEAGQNAWSSISTLFSKKRNENIDNEYVRMVQNKQCGDESPCDWLRKLYRAEKNSVEREKIKKALKRFNCDGKNRGDKILR